MPIHCLIAFLFFTALASHNAAAQNSSSEVSGEYEVKLDYRKNFALDRGHRDDLLRFDQELQLRWAYRHNDWISWLVEGKVLGEHQLFTGGRGRRSEVDPERGEMWLRLEQLLGRNLTLTIGRQNFEEPRRWWWDDDLDAVTIRYQDRSWLFEVGVGHELPRKSLLQHYSEPENRGVTRLLGRASWAYARAHQLDFFILHHNDHSKTPKINALVDSKDKDDSDARLSWVGLRLAGNPGSADHGSWSYWADIAGVVGSETVIDFSQAPANHDVVSSRRRQHVNGWAVDLGLQWHTHLSGQPTVTLGYAVGSGDKNPERGTDRSFRQTGLQSNDEEFRTYGELLRPELSNLQTPVIAIQFPILSKSHIELAYRYFRQVYATPFMRESRIDSELTGRSKNIGQEWMVQSVVKQWQNFEIELVGAVFRAGGAYGAAAGKTAYSLFTKVTWEFDVHIFQ